MDLHRGELTVASEVDEGSEFVLRLPLGNKHLKSEEIATEMMHEADPAPFVREKLVADDIAGQEGAEKPPLSEEGRATILLVEDNADMRWFLRDRLEIDNNVVEATDGDGYGEGQWDKGSGRIYVGFNEC